MRLALFSLFLLGCAAPNFDFYRGKTLRLYVLSCGEVFTKDISHWSPGVNVGKSKNLVSTCYLIRHPEGDLLWDTGISDELYEKKATWNVPQLDTTLRVRKPLLGQLNTLGIGPEDIEYVALSHLHGDHTGNLSKFSSSKILVQKKEYDAAMGELGKKIHLNTKAFEGIKKDQLQLLDGDYDVFGDRHVVIKFAPGHTPGHQMLYINLIHSGPILLSGDLYHFKSNRVHRRVPRFNWNRQITEETMTKMEKLVNDKRAQLWIQHDLEQNAKIPHLPAYFE
jgi:N-acyl homoserine lactone hydrolase